MITKLSLHRHAKTFATTLSLVLLHFIWTPANSGAADDPASPEIAFVGRWDLTITDSNNKGLPSWLELSREHGNWKARFVGRWGHARFLPTVAITNNAIHLVSPKDEEGSQTDLVFDGKLSRETLTGTAKGPDGTPWTWTAKRAPTLKPPAKLK